MARALISARHRTSDARAPSVLVIVALLTLASPPRARAQTVIEVPGDYPTIQQAMEAAAGGDTVLVASGTYVENLRFFGKAMTVESADGADLTTIDGSGLTLGPFQGSTVSFRDGEGPASVLRGFTITGGTGSTGPGPAGGGGIFCSGSAPTIEDCVISDNVTLDDGGGIGIQATAAAVTVTGCTIEGNIAGGAGGILVNDGVLTISNSVISGNVSAFEGGAIVCNGTVGVVGASTLTMQDCVVEYNVANGYGGGLYLDLTTALIEDTRFQGNDGPLAGGGSISVSSDVVLRRCSFLDNTSAFGGGVTFNSGSLLLERCVFWGNQAMQQGAAIDTVLSGPSLGNDFVVDHCTFYDNTVTIPGGGVVRAQTGQSIEVVNAILWQNDAPVFVDVGGGMHSVTYSLIEGGHAGVGNIDGDPLFLDPEAGDFALQADSPCIDAGDPDADLDADGSVTDMGAVSFLPALFTRLDANGDGLHDIADPVALLFALFTPGSDPLACEDAGDSNDDGLLDISDAVSSLSILFVVGTPPAPPPTGSCGADPTADGLGCESPPVCP